MRRAIVLSALLLVAACDKDRLPDDLTQVEGNAALDDGPPANQVENEAEVPPPPQPVEEAAVENNLTADAGDDPLAPKDSDPSFDCSAASGRVERHICAVPELGALDRRVAATFDRAMDEATTEQVDRLRNLGRQYLADRNRCRDDYCIRQAYRWYERDIDGVMGWPPSR
jgi:hypothetical protein